MSPESLRQEFNKRFGRVLDDEAVDLCVDLCQRYNLSEELFLDAWIAFSIQFTGDTVTPTPALIAKFESKEIRSTWMINSDENEQNGSEILKELTPNKGFGHTPKRTKYEKAERLREIRTPKSQNTTPSRQLGIEKPSNGEKAASISGNTDNYKFLFSNNDNITESRLAAVDGGVVCAHGKSLFNWTGSKLQNEIKLLGPEVLTGDCTYSRISMNDVFLKTLILDNEYCEQIAECLIKNNNLLEGSYFPDDLYIGRIRGTEGPCNPSFLFLDEVPMTNRTMNVDVTGIKEYSVFPGQMIAVKGTNRKNMVFASQIFTNASGIYPPAPVLDHPLQIMVAAGPFSPAGILDFSVMLNLVEHVKLNKPDILLLIGPFVEISKSLATSPDLNFSLQELHTKVTEFFTQLQTKLNTKICFINNYKDIDTIPVYPTPLLSFSACNEKNNCFPDPCVLNINGLHLGVTSIDILMHLSKFETSNIQGNRISRLCAHLLHQQSFCPLKINKQPVPLDLNAQLSRCRMQTVPHIMIIPSTLGRFIKVSDGCIFINPERCVKGAGSYFTKIEVRRKEENDSWSVETHIAAQICHV